MNDEKTKSGDGVLENHWCEYAGCKEWGGFGFAPNKIEKPRWWCWEHYPHKKNQHQKSQ